MGWFWGIDEQGKENGRETLQCVPFLYYYVFKYYECYYLLMCMYTHTYTQLHRKGKAAYSSALADCYFLGM